MQITVIRRIRRSRIRRVCREEEGEGGGVEMVFTERFYLNSQP
jgi:hypothetical protein